jgi:hypothetical protein
MTVGALGYTKVLKYTVAEKDIVDNSIDYDYF